MCWMTCTLPILITADEDVPILKVGKRLGDKMIAPYRTFTYEFGKIYKNVPLQLNFTGVYYYVMEGFHSYHPGELQLYKEYWAIIVAKGGLRLDTFLPSLDIFEGFIPEGAHYYLNMNGEIVSDQIVIICQKK